MPPSHQTPTPSIVPTQGPDPVPTQNRIPHAPIATSPTLPILLAVSLCHLLNDSIQALIPAIYPLLKDSFGLNFSQIGMITFTFQMVGSVFQPVVGLYTDRHPKPFSLVTGMIITLVGLILLGLAPGYITILLAAGLVGLGSAIFHPESSRMARLASGGRHGFAQSLFQVGGNAGTALGPILAAWIIVPHGQKFILWFSALAFLAIAILSRVGRWYQSHLLAQSRHPQSTTTIRSHLSPARVTIAISVLLILMFSKFFYLVSMTNYYTFYLMDRFHLGVASSQLYLFLFLAAGAIGTLAGGSLGDIIGRKQVIWLSILGIAPFAILMPHVNLFWTATLSIIIGLIMASAFPAMLVYATELLPGNVGLIAGLFFGLAFGLAGIGAAVLGKWADATSITHVMNVTSFLPLIGLLTVFLPDTRPQPGK